DVAVLRAAVADERVLVAGCGPRRVDDGEELDDGVARGCQPLPEDARLEVDLGAVAGSRRRPGAVVVPHDAPEPRRRLDVGEQVAHRQAERRHHPPERAHRRVDLVALDLRDQAGRHADSARELAYRQLLLLTLGTQTGADLRGRGRVRVERRFDTQTAYAVDSTGAIFARRYSQSRSNRYEWRSGGPGAEVSSRSTLFPTVS